MVRSAPVNLVSSVHNTQTFEKTVRTKSTAEHMRVVEKPTAIELYSRFMQGVDRSDQLLWYKLSTHRQMKWWKKLFMYMLEVSVVNACIIFKKLHKTRTVSSTKFRLAVVNGLLENYARPPSTFARPPSNPPSRLLERHFLAVNTQMTPAGRPTRPDCEAALTVLRNATRLRPSVSSVECRCAVPCFKRYHTMVDYKAVCSDDYHKQ